MGAATWQVEEQVSEALGSASDPRRAPPNTLFVLASVYSENPVVGALVQAGVSSGAESHPTSPEITFLVAVPGPRCQVFHRHLPRVRSWEVFSLAPTGLLNPLPIPQRAWSHIAVDFVTSLPPSGGDSVKLIVFERFSKASAQISLSCGDRGPVSLPRFPPPQHS